MTPVGVAQEWAGENPQVTRKGGLFRRSRLLGRDLGFFACAFWLPGFRRIAQAIEILIRFYAGNSGRMKRRKESK
jgi:hypothetical protein